MNFKLNVHDYTFEMSAPSGSKNNLPEESILGNELPLNSTKKRSLNGKDISGNGVQKQPPKKRKVISLELKLDIIKRLEAGEKNVEISKSLGLATSTIGTIAENRQKIKSSLEKVTPLSAKNVSRQRSSVMEELEKTLSIWIDMQAQRKIPLTTAVIQEKARSLHKALIQKNKDETTAEPFVASKGWFERFKNRYSLHNVKKMGEAASADSEAAREYPEELRAIIDKGGYTPQQVYNVDETGLFWKRMPSRTFISRYV